MNESDHKSSDKRRSKENNNSVDRESVKEQTKVETAVDTNGKTVKDSNQLVNNHILFDLSVSDKQTKGQDCHKPISTEDIPLPMTTETTQTNTNLSFDSQRSRLKFKLNRANILGDYLQQKQQDNANNELEEIERKKSMQQKIREELLLINEQKKKCQESGAMQTQTDNKTSKESNGNGLCLKSKVNLVIKRGPQAMRRPIGSVVKPKVNTPSYPLTSYPNIRDKKKLSSICVTSADNSSAKRVKLNR